MYKNFLLTKKKYKISKSQTFSLERNFFQMRWKSNQDMTLSFPQNLEIYISSLVNAKIANRHYIVCREIV